MYLDMLVCSNAIYIKYVIYKVSFIFGDVQV